ncbi:MAG: CAP domain-containing protein [Clostridia bacterium]|nr:CAP domain-containing protein [Clostridia bacterium]
MMCCAGCHVAETAADIDVTADIPEEGVVEVDAPERKIATRVTPPPTPSPTPPPTPTPAPTPKPTEKPKETAKPTKKPESKKTAAPEKTSDLTFVPDENAVVMPQIDNGADTAISTIFALTNQVRKQNGLNTLTESSTLRKAAATRAKEIAALQERNGSIAHTRLDGSSWSTVSSAAFAENIASGMNISHSNIMDGWINSPGHYKNMVNPTYNTIGVGFYSSNGWNYYVQLFGY